MATDIPELPHHPHSASGLPRWLEWTTAISALIISVCSIGIAIYNARIESRLLKANSYPYLVAGVSDGQLDGPNGSERISVELLNNGVGHQSGAETLARRLCETNAASSTVPGRETIPVTVSVGVAFARTVEDAVTVMERADVALYRAKAEGRNRVVMEEGASAWKRKPGSRIVSSGTENNRDC